MIFKPDKYIEPRPSKALIIKPGTGEENDFTNAQRYFDLYAKGESVAFVTEDNKSNLEYLKSRGITEVID